MESFFGKKNPLRERERMRPLIVLLFTLLFPFEICGKLGMLRRSSMGVLGERKNELHVINSKEGADKTESKDDDDGTYISIRIHTHISSIKSTFMLHVCISIVALYI